MERPKCKLCSRTFFNGRALGGHMRSHLMNMKIHSKGKEVPANRSETGSASSTPLSFSSEQEEEEEEIVRQRHQEYSLRESPKKSNRFIDPEFSFAFDRGSEVVLQDGGSETRTSKFSKKRPKRSMNCSKNESLRNGYYNIGGKKIYEGRKRMKIEKSFIELEHWEEPEQGSPVSDATTEEDVAFCLMLLSRDTWKGQNKGKKTQYKDKEIEEKEEEEEEFDEIEEEKSVEGSGGFYGFKRTKSRGKYKCEPCNKVFRSYQALGGHRASHVKNQIQGLTELQEGDDDEEEEVEKRVVDARISKIHECPYCFRVFGSGQALGGHKRSHTIATSTSTSTMSNGGVRLSFLDLNLPAPIDDEEFHQVKLCEMGQIVI